ncbi:MAG: hypothetical protein EOO46_21260 [Flavobacterium sp.]|nr:MAG: hypothetical protein EOO46_21260 [Flavobacterium sp.]
MRIFLIIGLLTFSELLAAQSWCDAIIKHRAYESLKRIVDENTERADSLKTKDSLVVTYYSKTGKIIKQENHHFRGDSCTYDQSITYFNRDNLAEFIEHFEQPCLTEEERRTDSSFEKLTYWYERFMYDSAKRVSGRVRWYPTVKARRFEYSYDTDGKMNQRSSKIKEDEFWN